MARPDDPTTHQGTPVRLDAEPPACALLVVGGAGRGRLFELRPGDVADFGRVEDASVSLPYSGVSRIHARATLNDQGRLTLRDCGSTNGTYIDGRSVGEGVVVRDGQRISLGSDTELLCWIGDEPRLAELRACSGALKLLAELTPRELEVSIAVASGLSSARVAKQLGVSPRTVTTHLDRIYGRLDLNGRAQLIRIVYEVRSVAPGLLPAAAAPADRSSRD